MNTLAEIIEEFFIIAVALLFGWYARDINDKLHKLVEYFKDRLETPAGVVRPSGTLITKNQPTIESPDSQAGVVRRPSPDELAFAAWKKDHPKAGE